MGELWSKRDQGACCITICVWCKRPWIPHSGVDGVLRGDVIMTLNDQQVLAVVAVLDMVVFVAAMARFRHARLILD